MKLHPSTLALHEGYTPADGQSCIAVPIYANNAYEFESAQHAADVFDLKEGGYIYSRINNPTEDVLEKRLAAYEGGVGALATSSGMSAISTVLITLLKGGDHVVASKSLYGGTFNLLSVTLPRFGITTSFVDFEDIAAVEAAITEDTRLLITETLGNPKLDFVDIDAVSEVAHRHDLPLMVDNTLTISTFRPIEHGADIVVHSLTKFVCGNGTCVGGAVIDAGRFNWACGKFPEFTEPSPGYHGLRFHESFGAMAFIVKLRVEGLRDFGSCISPYNAFSMIQGLETLDIRYRHLSATALRVAEWLENHADIAWVDYPGLSSHAAHERCAQQLKNGFGGLLTFGPKGGAAAACAIAESTKLFKLVANLGDSKSLISYPAGTTHRQLTEEQQREAGVTPDLIRLSIGLEAVEDIIADLEQAIEKARR